MENSGYIALARQMALQKALEVTTNNVANMRTTGFKAEHVRFEEFLQKPVSADSQLSPMSSVVHVGMYTDFSAGGFEPTGNTLDLAIQGDGFFLVETAEGTRYTRNGSFRLDDTGLLVTQNGHPVLDASGSSIQFAKDAKTVSIDGNGNVIVDGSVAGQVGVVRFEDPDALIRGGDSLYRTTATPIAADATVLQGIIEGANVQPIVEITRMIDILRNFESAQKMVEAQHGLALNAIAKIAKV